MRYRCSHCMELYNVGESQSLYAQSFCSKGCEVEAVVMGSSGRNFASVLKSLSLRPEEILHEVH